MNIFILTFFLVPADMLKNKVCTEIYSSSSCLNQNHIQKTNFRKQTILQCFFKTGQNHYQPSDFYWTAVSYHSRRSSVQKITLFTLHQQKFNTKIEYSLQFQPLSTSHKPHQILALKYCVKSSSSTLTGKQTWLLLRTVSFQARTSPQSECSLIFLTKLTAAILICMATEGWGESKICTRGAGDSPK